MNAYEIALGGLILLVIFLLVALVRPSKPFYRPESFRPPEMPEWKTQTITRIVTKTIEKEDYPPDPPEKRTLH